MATSSLTNMTVPLGANGQSASTQGLLMPKLTYRYRVFFNNFGTSTPTTELTKQVIKFDRPHLSFEEIKLPIYNSTIKLAGKYSWQDITCDLRDDAAGNVSKLVGEQLQKQLDFMEMASASAGIDYKFLTKFEVLDGGNGAVEPIVLESWELYGCYLKGSDYQDLNYGSNEAVSINMTIAYDNANQNPTASGNPAGIGIAVGRTLGDVVTGVGPV